LWIGLRGGEYLGLLPGLTLAGAGFGLVIAPVGATAIDAAPDADRGIAAAMTLVFRLLGMTVGISGLTAIGVRRLQSLVEELDASLQGQEISTAELIARQAQLLQSTGLQVVRETFLVAGVLALIALIPVAYMGRARSQQPAAGS
jgi:hypothetical protein